VPGKEAINHSLVVWRAGAAYDLTGNGQTALKASASRYGLQVGIDRVTNVNPFSVGSADCPWTDPNGNRKYDVGEINLATCPAFSGGTFVNYADDVKWPYSDEYTAGIETQLPGAVRVGAMFYYRTNRDQIGQTNTLQPGSAYTRHTVTIPNGPGGSLSSPKPMTADVYNISAAANTLNASIRDNAEYLDTEYKGVEFTATKRFSRKWQMQMGFTLGKNEGGVNPSTDLNDPNNTRFPKGIIGNDSEQALRLSGSYELPWAISLSGSMIANNGYPYVSTYSLTRAAAATQGITLTRASQAIQLSRRGDERYENVVMFDMRLGKSFNFGGRGRFTREIELLQHRKLRHGREHDVAVGPSYLLPAGGDPILSPRIIRVGFALSF
jgi:hypothetical protein